jgi:hypothetical protein
MNQTPEDTAASYRTADGTDWRTGAKPITVRGYNDDGSFESKIAAMLEAARTIFGQESTIKVTSYFEGDVQLIVNPPEDYYPLRDRPGYRSSRRPRSQAPGAFVTNDAELYLG